MTPEEAALFLKGVLDKYLDNGSVLFVENNLLTVELGDDEEQFVLAVIKKAP